MSRAACSKTRMNCSPIALRLASGSLTPANALRKRSRASTTTSRTPVAATNSCSTCSGSPSRNSPWLTKTQVSWSPTARCTSAAATDESTPPESAHRTRPLPTWARTTSTSDSTTLAGVQSAAMPAPRHRKFSRTRCPYAVCSTSGCHWTPNKRRSASSKAATGAPGVEAVTVMPNGASVTESP